VLGFTITLLLFIGITLLAAHLQSDCGLPGVLGIAGCADDIRRAGFPLLVWEAGGFDYRNNFNPIALIVDIGIGLGACVLVGFICQRYRAQMKT
jgi:hypothetical protein